MANNLDDIFKIIHSLPAIHHSIAISTRTPTAGYPQKTKYMPDYGGVLDIPHSNLKNYALATKLPFKPKPDLTIISLEGAQERSDPSSKCMIASQYLESGEDDSFSVISTSGDRLSFDYVFRQKDSDNIEIYNQYVAKSYGYLDYNDSITCLKHSEATPDSLIVVNEHCVKTYNLTRDFAIEQHFNDLSSPIEQGPADFQSSTKERKGLYIKDACLNHFNGAILSVASDNVAQRIVKVFDINRSNSRKPIGTIKFESLEKDHHADALSSLDQVGESNRSSRTSQSIGTATRTFVPMRPTVYGIQQLDCIPSHLVNMIITTAFQIALIDPRIDSPAQVFVEKTKLDSFYPTELLRRTIYSQRNPYQFYSLSNIHLRVFDTRFPTFPMNQTNHMLESELYDFLEMKLITYKNENLETLCCSAKGDLAFVSFDQTQGLRSLVNPESAHLPYHCRDPTSKWRRGSLNLGGLSVLSGEHIISPDPEWIFSVLHHTMNGLCLRDFKVPADDDTDMSSARPESQAVSLLNEPLQFQPFVVDDSGSASCQGGAEVHYPEERMRLDRVDEVGVEITDSNTINILDGESMIGFEDRFTSKRAIERFDKMQKRLRNQA